MGNHNAIANDIYGNKIPLNVPQRKLSAGSVRKFDGIDDIYVPKQHQEDGIDRIVKQYGQGTGYAKWQKERYPVKVDISLIQAQMTKKVDSSGNPIINNARLVSVFK